jgi:hypothetical protein
VVVLLSFEKTRYQGLKDEIQKQYHYN